MLWLDVLAEEGSPCLLKSEDEALLLQEHPELLLLGFSCLALALSQPDRSLVNNLIK